MHTPPLPAVRPADPHLHGRLQRLLGAIRHVSAAQELLEADAPAPHEYADDYRAALDLHQMQIDALSRTRSTLLHLGEHLAGVVIAAHEEAAS